MLHGLGLEIEARLEGAYTFDGGAPGLSLHLLSPQPYTAPARPASQKAPLSPKQSQPDGAARQLAALCKHYGHSPQRALVRGVTPLEALMHCRFWQQRLSPLDRYRRVCLGHTLFSMPKGAAPVDLLPISGSRPSLPPTFLGEAPVLYRGGFTCF